MEALVSKEVSRTHELIVNHIARIRLVPELTDATVVLALESNLGFECQHIIHMLQRKDVRRWLAMSEGANGSIGWLTTNERKEAMVMQLRSVLNVGCCALWDRFFSLSYETPHEALIVARRQLEAFTILVEPSRTPFGKPRKTYTGKIGGAQDDLCVALQLALTACRCFYSSERYQSYR